MKATIARRLLLAIALTLFSTLAVAHQMQTPPNEFHYLSNKTAPKAMFGKAYSYWPTDIVIRNMTPDYIQAYAPGDDELMYPYDSVHYLANWYIPSEIMLMTRYSGWIFFDQFVNNHAIVTITPYFDGYVVQVS